MTPFLDIDSFAGGGGASVGIEAALGKPIDIAINHDAQALAMHKANHSATRHFNRNIWQVDPADVAAEAPIRLAWFSPDCTHHSKAKGAAPIRTPEQRASRDLAWVVVLWARRARPQIIMLENVEEFADWGPLLENGKACPDRKGRTFKTWIRELRRAGYRVEWRELRASEYGAPTIRKRLFLIARRDGFPIRWPQPTHGPGLLPVRTAAECIDWHIPCPSIFLSREAARAIGCKRPLVEATMRRIARGVWKYVIDNPNPFIVPVTHRGDDRVHPIDEPFRTVTSARRGEFSLVSPCLIPRYGEREGQEPRCGSAEEPMPTVVPTGNGASLVAAFLAQHNAGMIGRPADAPMSTIVGRGTQQQAVAVHLTRQSGLVAALMTNQMTSNTGGGQGDLRQPINTILTGGHKALVKAFLIKYYGSGGQDADIAKPTPTLTAKARMGIVTVGEVDYEIADIGMRMFTARELFRAQGFPEEYRIAVEHDGKVLTKEAQIRMCGNSVCPPMAEALVRANIPANQDARAA